MRDSNYKSVGNNRAAITITTSLYDRRALDVTSDKPLVNSLNHLTYLVSSSAKVRETLSIDGGIERLIEILHECHNSTFNSNDTIFNNEKKILTAWKWTLTFQCIVLIGTRGTETIRQRVVKAGILPIIATVLDNYLSLHDRTIFNGNRRFDPSINFIPQEMPFLNQTGPVPMNTPPADLGTNLGTNLVPEIGRPGPVWDQEVRVPVVTTLPNTILEVETTPEAVVPNSENTVLNTVLNTANTEDTTDTPTLTTNIANIPIEDNTEENFMTQFDNFQNNFPMEATNVAVLASSMTEGSLNESFFNGSHTDSLTPEDYENLTVPQLIKLVQIGNKAKFRSIDEIKRRYIICLIVKKLKQEKDGELVDNKYSFDNEYDMDNNLQFLSDLYLMDDKLVQFSNASKVAPRNFTETGVVIPRDDDIVWGLQLLAYISKYPYLKDTLQNTHLLIDMSVKDKQIKLFMEKQMRSKMKKQRPTIKPKSRKPPRTTTEEIEESKLFSASASNSPQMLNGINSLQDDSLVLEQDKLELEDNQDPVDDTLRVNDAVESDRGGESDPELGSVSDSGSDIDTFRYPNSSNRLADLYDMVDDCNCIEGDLERELALFDLREKVDKCIDDESKNLRIAIIKKRLEQKRYLKEKWDYDNYKNFEIPDTNDDWQKMDYDDSLTEYKRVNLFPMVEKFTCLTGTDMYYWSGVIMRNSCRRNDNRGGVRQCGNSECGKWETYPREFSKCRKCKRTKYCSRECQMRAWPYHRNWCIPSSSNNVDGNSGSLPNEPER